jgi:hypothetical protein
MAPVMIEALIGHFEDAANVRGLVLVEEDVTGWSIAIIAVIAFEKSQSDESIEEVA